MHENLEKTHRALRRNVQTCNNNIFVAGDSVYYKQASDRWWRPATVLGKDGQQVLGKHGGMSTSSMSTSLRTKYFSKKLTTFYTETDHFESNTGRESNLPVAKTNHVASQDIPTEPSSDSKTDQPEQDLTESLPEDEIYMNLKQIWMHN